MLVSAEAQGARRAGGGLLMLGSRHMMTSGRGSFHRL